MAGLADATEARTLIRQLNQLYDENRRAFRVEEVAGGFELLTRPQFAPYLRRLGHVPQAIRLSSPAMETLAIVAYRQPVMRADIEAVRGVQSGELLRQLMERDLVRISGRSEELGRPYLYSTTKRFLQVFGLRSTEALPCADWFNEPNSQENDGSDPESSQKESDVSITIASDLTTQQESETPLNEAQASASAIVAPAPKAIDDEEWDEDGEEWDEDEDEDEEAGDGGDDGDGDDGDDDDDWDEESDDDWDEEGDDVEDGDEEFDDQDEDEDGDWEEVDDEESDEEWDDEEDDSEDLDDSEDDGSFGVSSTRFSLLWQSPWKI